MQGLSGHDDAKDAVRGAAYTEWLELDRILVQLHESHSIRLKVLYNPRIGIEGSRERARMNVLLPEAMKRGMVGLVRGDEYEGYVRF